MRSAPRGRGSDTAEASASSGSANSSPRRRRAASNWPKLRHCVTSWTIGEISLPVRMLVAVSAPMLISWFRMATAPTLVLTTVAATLMPWAASRYWSISWLRCSASSSQRA